jgi:ribonucleoside-diphosphate reductase alpha chain
MRFERILSRADVGPRDQVEWAEFDAVVPGGVFEAKSVEFPAEWSQNAVNIVASKYFRKAGVPLGALDADENTHARPGVPTVPAWLLPRLADREVPTGSETSAHQLFHRLAGCWTYWGWCGGYFDSEDDARVFYDETYLALARQIAAPNSPQWFNTGLRWAYGIEGSDTGQWRCDPENGEASRVPNSYEFPQPHACFLTPIADDLVNEGGIFDRVVVEGRIFKHGSGSGMNVSRLRGPTERLAGGGTASGAMSFLRVHDAAAGATKSGGTTRRAAKMVLMDIDHPEIEDFVDWKVREEDKAAAMHAGSLAIVEGRHEGVPPQVIDRIEAGFEPKVYRADWEGEAIRSVDGQNSNNGVRVTDAFMEAVENDQPWHLLARTTGEIVKTVRARDLFERICRATWAAGDPSLVFHDTINGWNTCSADGEIRTTNPCGEFHHLDGSACLLASLRLTKFLRPDGLIALDLYEYETRLWTVVLDISVGMASFPAREFAEGAWRYRTLGLGYMDLGALLMRVGLPYDSDDGRSLAAVLTALMTGVAYRTSAEIAEDLAPSPRWEANAGSMREVLGRHARALDDVLCAGAESEGIRQRSKEVWADVLGRTSFRNAQVTLLAPTGTISFAADCDTTGVEPDFALRKTKLLAGGGSMDVVNQAVPEALRRLGYDSHAREGIEVWLRREGSLDGCGDLRAEHAAIFDCVNELRPLAHVEMVAAVQPFLSGGVSKTVNLPRGTTVAEIGEVYRMAHRLGVKSIAPYRDGSKLTQPLSGGAAVLKHLMNTDFGNGHVEVIDAGLRRGEREYPPWRRTKGFGQKVKIGEQSVHLRVNEYDDGRPAEVFLTLSHAGSDLRAWAEVAAMGFSLALQHGTPIRTIVEKLVNTRFEPAGFVEGHERIKAASSVADYLGRELGITYLGDDSLGQVVPAIPKLDDRIVALAGTTLVDKRAVGLVSGYSGDTCGSCGSFKMRRAGACLTCEACGEATGCG